MVEQDQGTRNAAPVAAFEFTGNARKPAALIGVGLWLGLLAVLWLGLSTVWWILILLALPVAPALWDILRNPAARLTLDQDHLHWSCPRSEGDIRLSEIERVSLMTRWDFSTRTTVHTRPGTRHDLPPAVQPPGEDWEAALIAHGISVKRHHFTRF